MVLNIEISDVLRAYPKNAREKRGGV